RGLSDSFMRASIADAQDLINRKRGDCYAELGHFEQWRDLAADIRAHVLDYLDVYLDRFADSAQKAGASVYFAGDDREAVEIAQSIFLQKKARKAVKSKSMVTEEIGLNEALEAIGVDILETDLGEYLLQLDDKDIPSHIVIPALHKNRRYIRELLANKTGYTGDETPETMTRHVRGILREAFLTADIGVTGCNFAVADTGTVSLMTNEGNGRFVTSIPETLITFVGMERLVPSFEELDILFSMLARSAVGARTSIYMSLMTGPRAVNDLDGPRELHIIIVDNGRGRVLASRFRDVLRCIRCGACMLECPAYRHVGGHGYGVLYPGPLGAALIPVLAGYDEHWDVTKICSLCGACNDVCPVKIPLYESILEHRRVNSEEKKLPSGVERFVFSQYGRWIADPKRYTTVTGLARLAKYLPRLGPIGKWCRARELPRIPERRFRDWFADRKDRGNSE
ncbi:MAG: LutB/LldF family L-lactate oxidation iron-sulfur protein, partial [Acidobacteriota bacterium]